jgi:hypothetical protein
MTRKFFQILAKINKVVLPSFSKKQLSISEAKKWQLAILAYRYYVTKQALGETK